MAVPVQRPRGVIVLGVFRSGTSQMSRLLQELGVDFGPYLDMALPTRFNPWGFFQRRDVLAANNALLASAGCSAAAPADPEEILQRGDPASLDQVALDWRAGDRPWGLKDPRFCATLLTWIRRGRIDPRGLALVHVLRDGAATADSILRFPATARLLPDIDAGNVGALVVRYRALAAWHIGHLGLPAIEIWLEDLIANPRQEVARLARFVGATHPRAIESAVQCTNREQVLQAFFTRRSV